MDICSFSEVLDSLLQEHFFHLELFSLNPRHFVLLDFVGSVVFELIVREFMLRWLCPGSKTPEYFIGLRRRMLVCDLQFLCIVSILGLSACGCFFSSFLFLFILLFLLLFLGSFFSGVAFVLFLVIVVRVGFFDFLFSLVFLQLGLFFLFLSELHSCFWL